MRVLVWDQHQFDLIWGFCVFATLHFKIFHSKFVCGSRSYFPFFNSRMCRNRWFISSVLRHFLTDCHVRDVRGLVIKEQVIVQSFIASLNMYKNVSWNRSGLKIAARLRCIMCNIIDFPQLNSVLSHSGRCGHFTCVYSYLYVTRTWIMHTRAFFVLVLSSHDNLLYGN